MASAKYYNQIKAKHYLDMINSINDKYDEKIERLRAKRDKELELWDNELIKEKAKAIKESA
tara:strand:- start:295 stop:477 length:183 start_codon:yes stop_codon:yes gene_type:complete